MRLGTSFLRVAVICSMVLFLSFFYLSNSPLINFNFFSIPCTTWFSFSFLCSIYPSIFAVNNCDNCSNSSNCVCASCSYTALFYHKTHYTVCSCCKSWFDSFFKIAISCSCFWVNPCIFLWMFLNCKHRITITYFRVNRWLMLLCFYKKIFHLFLTFCPWDSNVLTLFENYYNRNHNKNQKNITKNHNYVIFNLKKDKHWNIYKTLSNIILTLISVIIGSDWKMK